MAETKRVTAAEKRDVKRAVVAAERKAQQTAEWEDFKSTYPVRFASLMYNYMNLSYADFRVNKVNDTTYEFSRNERRYDTFPLSVTPPAEFNWEFMNELEQAEAMLADYAAEQAEVVRKSEVRANALNKLNAEERALLNLY